MSEEKIAAADVVASADDVLVGKYFHTFKTEPDGCTFISSQGVVEGAIQGGRYLVQYFEWITGSDSWMSIVSVEDMQSQGWNFYGSSEQMVYVYKESDQYDRMDLHARVHVREEIAREKRERSTVRSNGGAS